MFLRLDNSNSLGLRASRMGINRADPLQRPNDACQSRINQGQRNRSEVIAVLRVEGRVTLEPSVADGDDDFYVWVRWKRLYLVTRKSDQPFDEKLSTFLR